ncbi:mevalonate kinase [Candidatus Roizmanbacteria bacterium CG_4_10_14_0_8_um_filter_39_9]|uniref:mevalonate kinase n=1 Tax=Candidatus Roizmanbacteria bacterium CG_4_10_14_0_8_um_filter_39_9 TaxID=1974829 RepID=A0A2M7QE80_9BACT|nr:MAG: mevalonate kinase [Candidatus Roizmanbacteria bacterium CG_4_10_14_0_8_um_filter_39_9]
MYLAYSSPGRVYLSGEHAVVYGKPALVTAINLRLTVTVEEGKKETKTSFIQIIKVVQQYLTSKKITHSDKSIHLSVKSNIPVGRGLGSSAALSVAAAAALLEFYTGKENSSEEINNCAYRIEKLFHLHPSGVDVSASCFGGLIYYRKEFEFLKNISRLNLKIPKNISDKLILIDTGHPIESTGQMVEMVGTRYNKETSRVEKLLNQIEKNVKQLVVSLMKEDVAFFKKTISENQKALVDLGVVSKKAVGILKYLEKLGVGKITGGGGLKKGSGFILFYAEDLEGLKNHLEISKIPYIPFSPTLEGCKKEL